MLLGKELFHIAIPFNVDAGNGAEMHASLTERTKIFLNVDFKGRPVPVDVDGIFRANRFADGAVDTRLGIDR